ncbi:hypothetical protein LQ327_01085 [Actinomycetospora endophytica]|uniref:N-acetyltransferase domain-containing protein n=1 Tax=Actinomycetospora endophytica TaxID=2291215 RepID=A0ABS8P165_9PSEU|nr:hypothetical protein [Actinomycetospora endophytica]MCD2191984.1 hypothetical protein [Actinomycetospora endophytica]
MTRQTEPAGRCRCGAAGRRALHPRVMDGADLARLVSGDATGLARLLIESVDALAADSEVEILVVCHHGRARLGVMLSFPGADTVAIAPLLTGQPVVRSHVVVALESASEIACRAGCDRLRLTVPADDGVVREIAERLGYELVGAGATPARPELDLPARDTWILAGDADGRSNASHGP